MPLHVERRDRVAVLTLDDPDRRNALTAGLVDEIVSAVDDLEGDDGVGALVVTGAPPAFCSGADVGSLAAMSGRSEDSDSDATPSRTYPEHARPPRFHAATGRTVGVAGMS